MATYTNNLLCKGQGFCPNCTVKKDCNMYAHINVKPPLGVTPEYIYEEKRIRELTRAINDYSNFNIKNNKDILIQWSKELIKRLENINIK